MLIEIGYIANLPKVADAETGYWGPVDSRKEGERMGVTVEHGEIGAIRSAGNRRSRIMSSNWPKPRRACRARNKRSGEVRQIRSSATPAAASDLSGSIDFREDCAHTSNDH